MWSVLWTGAERQWYLVPPKFNIVVGRDHISFSHAILYKTWNKTCTRLYQYSPVPDYIGVTFIHYTNNHLTLEDCFFASDHSFGTGFSVICVIYETLLICRESYFLTFVLTLIFWLLCDYQVGLQRGLGLRCWAEKTHVERKLVVIVCALSVALFICIMSLGLHYKECEWLV